MFSDKLFEAFALPKEYILNESYELFNEPNKERAAKLAQFNQLAVPYSHAKDAWFELRGKHGLICTAMMPRLGAGTTLNIRRIDVTPQPAHEQKGKDDNTVSQNFVWRLTTQYRLLKSKGEHGQAHKEWLNDCHRIERWRAALRPMESAAAECALGDAKLRISMSEDQVKEYEPWPTEGQTEWKGEAFSAQVHHRRYDRQEWSTLTVPPGQHIPMGLLAGQLCSRIFAPTNFFKELELSPDAPLVTRRDWDASWNKLEKEWPAPKTRREPSVTTAALAEAFQPVQPKRDVKERDRYPDYQSPFAIVSDPLFKDIMTMSAGVTVGAGLVAAAVSAVL